MLSTAKATGARCVMERVEERTLMSSVILSQFPAICMPASHNREAAPPKKGPSQAPSAGPRATPAAVAKPAAPQGLTATPVGNTVKLSWQKTPRAMDIVVDYSSDGGKTWTTLAMLGRNATKFTAEGLDSGKEYQFKLYAMNNKGTSPASEIVSAVLG